MDFTDKVVVITGGSSGIGAASALLFAKHGAYITIVGRNEKRLQTVSAKCEAERGNTPLSLKIDLTEPNGCEQVISNTIAKFGKINVLVNCAGKIILTSLFDENAEAFEDVLNVNLLVPCKLSRLALPYLIKTKGNIVNIVGAKYRKVRHGFLAYSIAKAGLVRFTNSAAAEVAGEGVRVNAVQPGMTRTNILSNFIDEESIPKTYEMLAQQFQLVEPEEVARMVVFVASDVCPNTNGASFVVNAGTSLT